MTAGSGGPANLDEIEARAAAATPGPWYLDVPGGDGHVYVGNRADGRTAGLWEIVHMSGDRRRDLTVAARHRVDDDAEFIAHAREDVPALVAEVKRRRGEAELHALCNDGCVPGAAYRMLTAELDAARAEADGLRRQLLDETYRPEGGEIVLRELRQAKRERDAAVAAAEQLRERASDVDLIRRAIADPGQFLPRGDNYAETIPSWSARAVVRALDPETAGQQR